MSDPLSGSLLTSLLDALVDGIAVHSSIRDEEGRIVDFRIEYANPAMARIAGVSREELAGHTILEVFPGRRSTALFDSYIAVVETGQPMVRTSRIDDAPGHAYEFRADKLGDGYVAHVRDVAPRSDAEDELFKSQEMLRLVLDTIPQRVFWKDRDSRLLGANAAFARDLGMDDPAEIAGLTDFDLGDRAAAERYRADDRQVMETGKPKLNYEEPSIRPDGSDGWIRTSKVPLRDRQGRIVGILGTFDDVTGTKRAEEALRRSENFLATIIENIPSMVFVKEAPDLHFVRVNRATEQALGYSRDQLVGEGDRGLAPAEEEEFFASVERRVLETGQPIEVPEETLTTPHRGQRIFHTTKIPIFDEHGRATHVLGISNDITDLKTAESARHESETRYRNIIESMTDYVVSVRIEHGRAVAVSHGPGCVAVTGYAASEFAANSGLWVSLVVPEDRELVGESMSRILSGVRIDPVEHRIRRKDGAVRWVRHTPVLRFDEAGQAMAYDGLIQDVTERRALEEQLQHAQKMEGIGRLAGGVAHDFNNLLTAILGYVEMCRMDLPPELPAHHPARVDLTEIAAAGERAASLTRQLLTFASRQIVAPVRLDMSTLVTDSLKMLGRLLGDDIEIETALDPSAGTIEADPGQIEQLLVNLVVNARDAMPNGGRLYIETCSQTAEEAALARPTDAPGPYVLLAVTDTGDGMTPEVLSHLFEPFFTTKELGKGTGLGLATCHGIVRQMGGHIDVYSEPGQGTTFRIFLPRKAGPADPSPAASAAAPAPMGHETVLVVEDEPRVRRLAVLGLRGHGYTVLEAANGPDAVAIAREAGSSIDLIVSDVMMPGMSGVELLRQLSELIPAARAILMSGHAAPSVLPAGSGLRHAFLPKPYTPERMARKVREVLDATEWPTAADS